MIVLIIVFVILLVLALQFWRGKWIFLLSGYNNLEKNDETKLALCRLSSKMMLGAALGVGLLAWGLEHHSRWLFPFGIAIILVSLLGGTLYGNTASRFQQVGQHQGKRTKSILASILTLVVALGVIAMFIIGTRPPEIEFTKSEFKISALYGKIIDFAEIMEVTLIDLPMRDIDPGRRMNGFDGGGGNLRGHFEKGLLFVHSQSKPTLKIVRWEGEDVYISYEDTAETKNIYEQLLEAMAKYEQDRQEEPEEKTESENTEEEE